MMRTGRLTAALARSLSPLCRFLLMALLLPVPPLASATHDAALHSGGPRPGHGPPAVHGPLSAQFRAGAVDLGARRQRLEAHTPLRMMVRPAISFSSRHAWTRSGAT